MKSNDNTFIMSPKVDFCFKELLNDEDVRRGFIAAILGVKADMIQRTELLPTYLRKQHQKDKLGILDTGSVGKWYADRYRNAGYFL